MKIVELEIEIVRGIKSLTLAPDCKNLVIWGPNGSGKSAVVDAIDFLLTGRISRLTGKGTRSISLKAHGPHVDHKPKEAAVKALIQFHDSEDPVELKRCMSDPNTLIYDDTMKTRIQPILDIAARGQHVLTRREILKYITAEPSTRAQEIQTLLDLNDVEDIRKSFVRTRTLLDQSHQEAKASLRTAQIAITTTIGEDKFDEQSVLFKINEHRKLLGASPISALKPSLATKGLKLHPAISPKHPVNVSLVETDINTLLGLFHKEKQIELMNFLRELSIILKRLKLDQESLLSLSRLKLYREGINLIDESGKCPLCDKSWPPRKLREYLDQRIAKAKTAKKELEQIEEVSETISGTLEKGMVVLRRLVKYTKTASLKRHLPGIEVWLHNLESLFNTLNSPPEELIDEISSFKDIPTVLLPSGISKKLKLLLSAIKEKYPEVSPQQTAWDTLTRIDENVKSLEKATVDLESTLLSYMRSDALLQSFVEARDEVLKNLYDGIKNRFVELYKAIHGPDEQSFSANIIPDDAGLKFQVDFYGRGAHPPHALHSEGHQDSMGICLYLALAEKLSQGKIDLIVLDDVVMSVDIDHRQNLCKALSTFFPGRQFLITTHDKSWAYQLKQEGIVTSNAIIEFSNWHIETGPLVGLEKDVWTKIYEDLENNDVPAAASRLRRYSEEFFSFTCDSLQASVKYRLDGRNDLGDFLPSAVSRLSKLLKKAKRASQSWGKEDDLEMLTDTESTVGQIYARTSAEQWVVNRNIHYTRWLTFSPNEFRHVAEAFQDLCGLFICSKCQSKLELLTAGYTEKAIRCRCSAVNWNLEDKPKNNGSVSLQ